MNSRFKYIKYISIILLITVLLSGCTQVQDKLEKSVDESKNNEQDEVKKEKIPENGGSIVLPLTKISTLNPITNKNQSYFYFIQLIYEGLFELDEHLEPKEKLVESYSIENDGRIINMRLRDDVYWHDGNKLTAEDVVFTLEVIKNAGKNSIYGDMIVNAFSPYYDVNLSTAINASGSGNNLTINFPNGYSNNLEVLTFPIIPRHLFNDIKHALSHENYPLIGTGPFKFESHTKLKEISLVANDDYREGRPYLDKIKGRIYNSEDDIDRAFEIGQVNMAVTKEADWEKYGTVDRMKVLEYTSGNYEFIGFNFNKSIFADEEGKILRKAIAYAIDREKIINNVYYGNASSTDVPMNPHSWLNQGDLNKYGRNIKLAKNHLKELGYEKEDGNGYLLDANGNRLTINLLTNTLNSRRYNTAEMIRQDLKEVGIELIIEPEERIDSLTDDEKIDEQWVNVEKRMRTGNFDMVLGGWEFSPIENMGYMFHSANRGNKKNFINFSNKEIDQAIENLLVSGASRDLKRERTKELSNQILEQLPYISLYYKNEGLLMDKNIYGDIEPVILNPYRGMKNVFKKYK